jgi:hypothetical protein
MQGLPEDSDLDAERQRLLPLFDDAAARASESRGDR